MVDAAIINIRTDTNIKTQARKLAGKLGFSLSAIINAYLRQFIRTKSVNFSLAEQPTDDLLKTLRESKKDIKKGFVSPDFDSLKKADKWLDSPKAKYENQI